MIFAISTAGWDQHSVCFEQRELARQVAEGTADAAGFLGVVYGADMDADWTDEQVWRAANPSLGETASRDFYREAAGRAQAMPTEQNTFRTLLLSQWVGQAERFLDMQSWDRCSAVPTSRTMAFGGLDLSATQDLTAFTVLAEGTDVYCWAFLPAEGIVEKGSWSADAAILGRFPTVNKAPRTWPRSWFAAVRWRDFRAAARDEQRVSWVSVSALSLCARSDSV